MKNYLSMGLEIKKFTAKKAGIVYYVAFDAYNRPAKIVEAVSQRTGQYLIIDEEDERRLLHKFSKIAKSEMSIERRLNNFIDESIIKHPVVTHTVATTAAVAGMALIAMIEQ